MINRFHSVGVCSNSGLVVFVDTLVRVHLVLSLDGALMYFFDRHVFYDV